MNLTERLKPRPASNKYANPPEEHPLKTFFRARGITQVALCELLRIHQSDLSMWLSGVKAIPLAIERRLKAVAGQILREEEKANG